MTEPDNVTALAAQLEELRGHLARCQAAVNRLEGEDAGPVMTLLIEVKHLREHLETALEKNRLRQPPAPWWRVPEAEGTTMLADLRKWVDTFLRPNYPAYAARLPDCWVNHPEAVWELSTVRAEWKRVYSDEENRDLQGALVWHDKWLPGALSRLATAIRCDQLGCHVARSPPRRPTA
jgi:hypothetical protein